MWLSVEHAYVHVDWNMCLCTRCLMHWYVFACGTTRLGVFDVHLGVEGELLFTEHLLWTHPFMYVIF